MKCKLTLELEIHEDGTVEVLNSKQVKAKTEKVKKSEKQEGPDCDILLRKGSLKFSNKLIDAINAKPGDLVDIKYEIDSNNVPIPIIATCATWCDEDGNKLTGQQSMAYKGENLDMLKAFGEQLFIEKVVSGKVYITGDINKRLKEQSAPVITKFSIK